MMLPEILRTLPNPAFQSPQPLAVIQELVFAGAVVFSPCNLSAQGVKKPLMFVCQLYKLFGNLLLEIESRVQLHQGRVRPLEFIAQLSLSGSAVVLDEFSVKAPHIIAGSLDLRAEFRQSLHVTLPALDFLVQNHPIESLTAFDELL